MHQEPKTSLELKTTYAEVQQEPKRMTDQQISFAVEYTLLTDAALYNNQIDVTVNQGIVTLTGGADNVMAKERAAKLAQTIRGVRGVVNTLALKTPSRSDNDIRKDVASALLYDAATDSYELKSEVKGGVVTLSGTVPSYREKQLAVYVAKGVKGVKEVKDSIALKGKIERSDAEIAAEVKRAIAIDVWLHPIFIDTDVKDGVVTLTGSVGSPAQYDRADLLAWTAGVKSVHAEGLKIEPWTKASGQRQETVAVKGDPQIKQAVRDAFVYDPRVNSFNPHVEVDNGVVTLSGVVDNLKAKRAAEQDAKNTWGVWRVKNLLKNRPIKTIADDKLAQNVVSAFLRDPIVDSFEINVKAKKGVVALNGTVDSYYEKAQAEDIASRANGVLDVENNLTVGNPTLVNYELDHDSYWGYLPSYSYWGTYRAPDRSTWRYASDAVLKDDITNKLVWSPWLGVDDITVSVVNGIATLAGYVGSRFELNKATQIAYEGGAQQVHNNISIR
jgi:osmotically-inducible protein OsmY